MSDAGRWCLPDPARKAHWIAMSSNSYGDGSTRGFDKLPPDLYQPDPALAGYPPPQPAPPMGPIGYGQPGQDSRTARSARTDRLATRRRCRSRTSALPDVPRPYQQMLRGPQYRWWKPLLCLVLVLPLALFMMGLAIVPVLIAGLVTGAPDLVEYIVKQLGHRQPGSDRLHLPESHAHRAHPCQRAVDLDRARHPASGSSPLSRVESGGDGCCAASRSSCRCGRSTSGWRAIVTPFTSPRPDHWVALLVIVLLMTPLQAAGEEYFFRGWIMQNVGAWFARPMVGLVVSIAVSAVAFSTAHLSPDPWVLGTIACLAVASGLAAWRTGGLEAGIAMHAVNNMLTFTVVVIFGGWSQAFVRTDTTGTPVDAAAGSGGKRERARLDPVAGQTCRAAALLPAARSARQSDERPAGTGVPSRPVPGAVNAHRARSGNSFRNGDVHGRS